jgi:hypothetical protein
MEFGNELSEFDHEAEGASRSLLLKLMDKKTVKSPEKRAHERFQAKMKNYMGGENHFRIP